MSNQPQSSLHIVKEQGGISVANHRKRKDSSVPVNRRSLGYLNNITHSRFGLTKPLMALAALCLCFCAQVSQAEPESNQLHNFEIKSEQIADALKQFALQTDSEILFSPDIVKGKKTDGLKGEYTESEALRMLLNASGLIFEKVDDKVFVVRRDSDERSESNNRSVEPKDEAGSSVLTSPGTTPDNDDSQFVEEEVVVVGSHIRGIQKSASPVTVFTREDLAASGYVTTLDFLKSLPQNHGIGLSSEGGSVDGINQPNLRGLGRDNTLTLINGRRLAPTALGGGYDISAIPLSAIARIEVLTDGASAQYGSESVGGVINIVLLDHYTGGQTQIRHSSPTRGGSERSAFVQSLSTGWGSGRLLANLNYEHNSTLHASERAITADNDRTRDLQPEATTKSGLLRIEQEITDNTELYTDALYNNRISNYEGRNFTGRSENNQISAVVGVKTELAQNWLLDTSINYGENLSQSDAVSNRTGNPSHRDNRYTSKSLDFKADGDLFSAPGGQAKLAIGGQYRKEDISSLSPSDDGLYRTAKAIFSELFIPLAGKSNGTSETGRLDFTASVRHDDYDDFGGFTSPKLGLIWSPMESLNLRTTWGKAVRAPRLTELRAPGFPAVITSFPDPQSTEPNGRTFTINRLGRIESLAEETSTNWTLGLDFEPESLPGLKSSITYYDVDFKDQIGGILVNLQNEGAFSQFIRRRPDPSDTAAHAEFQSLANELFNLPGVFNLTALTNADNVDLLLDSRITNIAGTRNRGLDLDIDYQFETEVGDFNAGVTVSYLLENSVKAFSTADSVEELNTLGRPTDLRLKGQLSWHKDNLNVDATFNHTDSYQVSSTITTKVPSDNTLDLSVRYRLDNGHSNNWLNDTELSFYVRNLFDRDPPTFLSRTGIPSYTTGIGGSLEGRLLTFQLTKNW